MTNPHVGNDALAFLKSITPDTSETRLAERQELFRIVLTQALRNLRVASGLTQEELASRLGVQESWVTELESANNDHTFESVLAYLSAMDADFELAILQNGEKVTTVAANLGMTQEEVNAAIRAVLPTDGN